MDKAEKTEVINAYKTHEGDTGSPEVQIAILTKRINHLNEHLKITRRTTIPGAGSSRWSGSAADCSTT